VVIYRDPEKALFFIPHMTVRIVVPLKNGSPQEIRINPAFNELLAT
jgi:hypothetical protein